VTVNGAPDPARVDAMRAALVHRGPDEGSTDVVGRCALGHQRLRVIDLETGQQPVSNETGDVVAVFNGEAYNFGDLRAELAANGHEVRGTGDTPVIPHLYEEDGPDFVRRLGGMFALALWDATRERLVLARDRVGKKPLLWTRLPDGTLAFASELKALLRLPEVSREVDRDAIDAYLALQYVPGDRTGLRGIRKLLPGHVLVAEGESLRIERYWTLAPDGSAGSDDEWLERVRATVVAAVRRRLVADVPLGALLSGGIDSSLVVAAAAQATSEPLRTFTVGFPDARYDERTYARAVADRYGTIHEELEVDADVSETVLRLAEAFDEPFGDEAAFPTFLIAEQARRHVTVALTGDGGDEAFGGYERYAAIALADRVEVVPSGLLRGAARAVELLPGSSEPRSAASRAARFLRLAASAPHERYGGVMEIFPAWLRQQLWADDDEFRTRSASELLGPAPRPGTAGLQELDVATYLPGALLVKADVASMAHSLELRSPFLDHEVLELGLALPERLKVRGRTGKVAVRRAFARELPEEVLRRGKTGFGVPLGRWFREDLRELAHDVLLDDRAQGRGWFWSRTVRVMLELHESGKVDVGHRLWCLLMLELWLRTHVESTRPVSTLVAS
ncbi:MAG: asparagine synthase (glutamine-hydrolyzing), partial [Actinomycetota bacterium]|nr:asparagine synthase (glutamine-hydrolyzing) [Actinomycetota bacterium]